MKKGFFLLVLMFGMFLSACENSPGIEESSLPPDFYVQKAIETGEYISLSEEKDLGISTSDQIFPTGDYLLLGNLYGTNLFQLSFISNDREVCHWEKEIVNPHLFQDKESLYIIEENCPGIGEDVVISWDLSQEKAFLNEEEIEIWFLVGSKYFKN